MNIKSVLIIAILPIVIVGTLLGRSEIMNRRPNGFQRTSSYGILLPDFSDKTTTRLKAIAGLTPSSIYFSTFSPGQILITDFSGKQIAAYKLKVDSLGFQNTFVDSPFAYIVGGNTPAVFKCDLRSLAIDKKLIPGPILTRASLLYNDRFMFRQFKNGIRDQVFTNYDFNSNTLTGSRRLFASYRDGGVVTDGMLNYDQTSKMCAYVYYHKGGFELLDTNLNFKGSVNTIDTFHHFQNTAAQSSPNHLYVSFTSAQPPKIVNRASCLANGRLYIYSEVKADNEPQLLTGDSMPIDIYDAKQGKYQGSFYLPKISGETIFSFTVTGNKLIAIYKTRVAYFTIPAIPLS